MLIHRCPESNLCTTADALEVTNHTIGVTAILTALLRRPSTYALRMILMFQLDIQCLEVVNVSHQCNRYYCVKD